MSDAQHTPDDATPECIGQQVHDSITNWARYHNDDHATLVTRVVIIIAECLDKEGRWIERAAWTSDGRESLPWDTLGLLAYADIRERADVQHSFNESCGGDDE